MAGGRLLRSRGGRREMASNVAEQLRHGTPQARSDAPAALEAASPGTLHEDQVLIALSELRMLDVEEVSRETFERVNLLLGRLSLETSDDPAHRVVAAVWGDGRFAAFCDVRGVTIPLAVPG